MSRLYKKLATFYAKAHQQIADGDSRSNSDFKDKAVLFVQQALELNPSLRESLKNQDDDGLLILLKSDD